MIKVIKEGKLERFKKTCSVCGCEFEYDISDLYKEYNHSLAFTTYPVKHQYKRYVNCPCCGTQVYHDTGVDADNDSNYMTPTFGGTVDANTVNLNSNKIITGTSNLSLDSVPSGNNSAR